MVGEIGGVDREGIEAFIYCGEQLHGSFDKRIVLGAIKNRQADLERRLLDFFDELDNAALSSPFSRYSTMTFSTRLMYMDSLSLPLILADVMRHRSL